jgi:dihydroflavonol-4-reductase
VAEYDDGVPKTLLTGATGFVGSHLARALHERGDELRLLIRRSAHVDALEGVEYERATGDVTDRRAVNRAMKGVDRVFHVAGRTSMRSEDRDDVFETNLTGARIVFESALDHGVERLVHTSTGAAIGAAADSKHPIDESAAFEIGHLGIAYVNSKHEAEFEALRLAARGLPVVIVNPSFVLGPDDPTNTSMGLVKRFLLRRIPAYVDGGLNIVDVRDVAAGHLLADEKGAIGERYILGGRNFTLDRLFADLARISGVPAPRLKVPTAVALGALEAGAKAGVPLPGSADEVRSASMWWTYSNAKAKRELGFEARPHEETLEAAVAWQRSILGDRIDLASPGRQEAVFGAIDRTIRIGGKVIGR